MSVAKYVSTTHGGKAVRYIEADLDTINVESISGKSVEGSGKYGINGTFFSGTTLTGIAVNRGKRVAANGDATTGVSYKGKVYSSKRGTMYYFDPAAGIHFFDTKPVGSFLEYPNSSTSNVRWAIGGYSLHPTKAYSSSAGYYSEINGTGAVDKEPTADSENAYRFSPQSSTARTAIGYRVVNSEKKIILAVFDNQNAWNVREFMRGLNCTFAIMLDGGGSSQIRYKSGSSNGFWCPKPDSTMRPVHSMVTVTATTWN